jgi:hypothetical protein
MTTNSAPALSLRIAGKVYPVETYADASEMVLAALEKYHGRYSDLPCIDLLNSKGRVCGHVSTNGRVWLGGGSRSHADSVQVYPPRSGVPAIATGATS